MNTNLMRYSPITQDYTKSKFVKAKELRRNMTPAERKLWHMLKGERLSGLHVRRQQAIRGFIVDFYCHRLRLVIEVDGSVHDMNLQHDVERTKALADTGMTVLRFSNNQIFENIGLVLH